MAETLLSFNDQASLTGDDYLIVPVPTATTRRRQRGFDHAELLARRLSANLHMPTLFALGRRGQTRQVGAKRSVRTTQLASSFYVRRSNKIKGRNILLVDDVVTTGSTLRAVTKTLRTAGAKGVNALVFAKRL